MKFATAILIAASLASPAIAISVASTDHGSRRHVARDVPSAYGLGKGNDKFNATSATPPTTTSYGDGGHKSIYDAANVIPFNTVIKCYYKGSDGKKVDLPDLYLHGKNQGKTASDGVPTVSFGDVPVNTSGGSPYEDKSKVSPVPGADDAKHVVKPTTSSYKPTPDVSISDGIPSKDLKGSQNKGYGINSGGVGSYPISTGGIKGTPVLGNSKSSPKEVKGDTPHYDTTNEDDDGDNDDNDDDDASKWSPKQASSDYGGKYRRRFLS